MEEAVPPSTRATVVVIDDDADLLELTTLLLARLGYHAIPSSSATHGIALVEQHRPELALLDYMLPDMDGLAALRIIRERHPHTSVIMFSGRGNEELVAELMKAGAAEYLLKPFNTRTLQERIEGVLRVRSIELANHALQREREHLLAEIESWNRELQFRVRDKTEALQRAQTEITQTEKLAAVGYLSAGMAHEIRNPLNSISLFTQLLKQAIDDEELRDYLDKILKEVDRVDSIIRKLVDAANRSRTITSGVRIDQVVQSALEVFTPQIEALRTRVRLECRCEPPPLKADPTELEQIFTNLFLNALEEMPAEGQLTIVIDRCADQIVVLISDTGGGIAPELQQSVFEPFFSTKSRGTGIGLPVVRRIARLYHGDVTIAESSPQGTTFRVSFPVQQEQ